MKVPGRGLATSGVRHMGNGQMAAPGISRGATHKLDVRRERNTIPGRGGNLGFPDKKGKRKTGTRKG